MRRKGRTRTMKMGMKAMMRAMTQTRARRASSSAKGKRTQPTSAPQ